MNKTWLIIKREYITRVRKLTFIIMTILMPILIVGVGGVMVYLSTHSTSDKKIAVLDANNFFNGGNLESHHYLHYSFSNDSEEDLKKQIDKGDFDAALIIPKFDLNNQSQFTLYSKEQMGLSTQKEITDDLNDILVRERMKEGGISPDDLNQIQAHTIQLKNITQKGEDKSAASSFGIAYASGFLLYFFMLAYGMGVMRSVMEEKTNRIAEIIVSSVRPFQLMLGKILGVALVGLTQFLIWVLLLLIVGGIALGVMGISLSHGGIDPTTLQSATQGMSDPSMVEDVIGMLTHVNWWSILGWFLFYFLGGYFLYAAMYAAVGSLVDDDQQESQQFTLPITIPIIIAFVMMTAALQDPNSGIAVFGSIFPFTSPIVMMARIPFGVPAWQLIVSALVLVLSFLFITWIAAKIYRTGILLYGKKITWKEISRWVLRK